MELSEFVKNTLIGIQDGIHQANLKFATDEGKTIGKDTTAQFVMEAYKRDYKEGYIAFDVAVTVSEGSTASGGGGINVAMLRLGGDVGHEAMLEHVSRIKFHVIPNRSVV